MQKVARLTPHFYFSNQNHKSIDEKYDSMGGMQIQLSYLKDLLIDDVEQDIFTLWNPNLSTKNIQVEKRTNIVPINCHLLPFRSKYRGTILLNEFWVLFTILYLIKQKKKYDLFHIHCSGVSAMFLMGYILNIIFKIPIVYTIHCSRNFTYKNMTIFDKIFSLLHKKLEILAIKKSFRTIVLTNEIKQKYLEFIDDKDKIVVIPDCVSLEKFQVSSSTPDILFKKYGLNFFNIYPQKIILFVGRIAEEKGWSKMIEIAEKISDEYIVLLCGSGNQRDELKSIISDKKLHTKVYCTGYIEHNDVGKFMKIADFLIIPSKHEEFGGICLEAFASKLFVIANKVGGLIYNIEDRVTGRLVQDNRTETYLEIIDFYSNSVNKAKKNVIINNAFEKVKNFSKDKIAEKYKEIYRILPF